MKSYAVFNGDHLAEQVKKSRLALEGIVCREALVSGPLTGETWEEFWETRTRFLTRQYGTTEKEVKERTVQEVAKVWSLPKGAELSLWFEDDLFCQVNLWFILSLLDTMRGITVFRVFPPDSPTSNRWKGFEGATGEDLEEAYSAKVQFTSTDLELGKNLWEAYRRGDGRGLSELSKRSSPCFRLLKEVGQAQLDRLFESPEKRRPEKAILELVGSGIRDFETVFSLFTEREGIYGFGDLQVRELFDKLKPDPS